MKQQVLPARFDQLSRHAERYPTSAAGDRKSIHPPSSTFCCTCHLIDSIGMLALLQRIKASNVTLKGHLEFVNDWQYFSLGAFTTSLSQDYNTC